MTQAVNFDEPTLLMMARSGGQEAFQRLVDGYRRELLVHCYRILGSLEDAEDTLQEALLRAWRRLDSFEQRSSLRAWLYKIATNAALDELDRRPRRLMPNYSHRPGDPAAPLPEPSREILWLEPLPDTFVDDRPASDPAARYEAHESVTLAFLVALQHLPGRQRAVLILRDVLGWHADEVAASLDMSVQAANSALQRARATLKQYNPDRNQISAGSFSDEQTAALLHRYVEAWEASDASALVALLHEDAALTMPPYPLWFQGSANIGRFFSTQLFPHYPRGSFRLLSTRANGSPAFAVYQRADSGIYLPAALHVLTIKAGQIAAIDDFLEMGENLVARFGLPVAI